MNWPCRIAWFCGACPLLVGISIFVLWLITHWQWLMMAGLITICGGIALIAIGMIALVYGRWNDPLALAWHGKRFWMGTIGCVMLMSSNIPVAAGLVTVVVALETRYTVVVCNASQQPLEKIHIFGGGVDRKLDAIASGKNARCSFWVHGDGPLEMDCCLGSTTHSGIIDGYVTGNMGGRTVVTVQDDGEFSVVKEIHENFLESSKISSCLEHP
jgi:hypothetical protein